MGSEEVTALLLHLQMLVQMWQCGSIDPSCPVHNSAVRYRHVLSRANR